MKNDAVKPRGSVIAAAERAVGKSPCMNCPDRYPGCSGQCGRYKSWKYRVIEARVKFGKQEKGVRDAETVLIEGCIRAKESMRKASNHGFRKPGRRK